MAAKWKRLYIGIPEGYIKPEGTVELVAQGEADVTNYATANVNIPAYDGTYEDIKSGYTVTLLTANYGSAYGSFDYVTDNNLSGTINYGETAVLENVFSITISNATGFAPSFYVNGSDEVITAAFETTTVDITEDTTIECRFYGGGGEN